MDDASLECFKSYSPKVSNVLGDDHTPFVLSGREDYLV